MKQIVRLEMVVSKVLNKITESNSLPSGQDNDNVVL